MLLFEVYLSKGGIVSLQTVLIVALSVVSKFLTLAGAMAQSVKWKEPTQAWDPSSTLRIYRKRSSPLGTPRQRVAACGLLASRLAKFLISRVSGRTCLKKDVCVGGPGRWRIKGMNKVIMWRRVLENWRICSTDCIYLCNTTACTSNIWGGHKEEGSEWRLTDKEGPPASVAEEDIDVHLWPTPDTHTTCLCPSSAACACTQHFPIPHSTYMYTHIHSFCPQHIHVHTQCTHAPHSTYTHTHTHSTPPPYMLVCIHNHSALVHEMLDFQSVRNIHQTPCWARESLPSLCSLISCLFIPPQWQLVKMRILFKSLSRMQKKPDRSVVPLGRWENRLCTAHLWGWTPQNVSKPWSWKFQWTIDLAPLKHQGQQWVVWGLLDECIRCFSPQLVMPSGIGSGISEH